jgi:hypothetical protein
MNHRRLSDIVIDTWFLHETLNYYPRFISYNLFSFLYWANTHLWQQQWENKPGSSQ